ncbi:hypothetical protein E3O55_08500 [Cryobacterium sp. MDB1-18-2]|uniref:hypothetical protein n=1 Tax=unclassified Cryobacterium TaxID=2649013 RepID=UPI001069854F|nr:MULTISPECIES: hypothetical protein [unclassified Cryobacterium]TFC30113.1 hypothetical protein E3O55_08500 [Cryobacterium sp. MDB1-18-2]TFC41393.1 hypothetical protein E3O50_09940 [Cryobacterium sp. MDB1-18-1]
MATSTTPGPKPAFLLVEKQLKCQTDDGEISIDTRIPLEKLELFMTLEQIPEKEIPRYILDTILSPVEKDKIEGLTDGVEAFTILLEFAKAVGTRLGMSLGESVPSTASSESTNGPSATTSDTASE